HLQTHDRPNSPLTMVSHIRTHYSVFWNASRAHRPTPSDARHPPHTPRTKSPNFVAQPNTKKGRPSHHRGGLRPNPNDPAQSPTIVRRSLCRSRTSLSDPYICTAASRPGSRSCP